MVNMNVGYVRSCQSLTTLQDEIERRWPGREQNLGFISGYPDGARDGSTSGHYPDHNGITYAYDIGVDIQGDQTGITPAAAEWLADYLCDEMHPRFQYLIYDSRIRGNHTGWKWAPYGGSSPHRNHIHISVADGQWGEPRGIEPEVYDSRKSWGVAGAKDPQPQPARDRNDRLEQRPKSGLYWTVESGDTLAEIAGYYAVGVQELARHNKIADVDHIEVGDYIRIPTPLYWTIQRGDTLQEIGKYYGLDWQTVADNAGISNPKALQVGKTIRVA